MSGFKVDSCRESMLHDYEIQRAVLAKNTRSGEIEGSRATG